jgi:hypothetical protein
MRDVFAEEILGKIRQGENVKYDKVNIKGVLNLAEVNLSMDKNEKVIVKSEISIENSKIEGDIDFRNAVFHNPFRISGTIIDGDSIFSGTCFCKEIYAMRSQFNGQASFAGATFIRRVVFLWARFGKSTSFSNSTFKNDAQFDDAEFSLDVNFEAARFSEFAYFIRAKFNGDANFRGAKFERNAEFKEAEFHLDANFTNAVINGIANFNKSQFNNRIYVPWDSIKNHLAYDGSTYLSLVKNYNNLEKFDDADECYYQYRKLRQKKLPFQQRISDSIPFLALGYGVHPEYPLIIGLVIITIFAIIYSLGESAYSPQNATILSVAIFATQTRMESFTGLIYVLSIIEGILGVFLMACFIVSLAKKTLR